MVCLNEVERLKEGLEKELSLAEKVLKGLEAKDVPVKIKRNKLLEIRGDLSEYDRLGGFSELSEEFEPLEKWRRRLLSETGRLLEEGS